MQKNAEDGPEAAQAGFWTTQERAFPNWTAAPPDFHQKPGRFWAVLGSVLGPKLAPKSFKIGPGARRKKGVKICTPKNPPGEPERELQEVPGRPPARLKS